MNKRSLELAKDQQQQHHCDRPKSVETCCCYKAHKLTHTHPTPRRGATRGAKSRCEQRCEVRKREHTTTTQTTDHWGIVPTQQESSDKRADIILHPIDRHIVTIVTCQSDGITCQSDGIRVRIHHHVSELHYREQTHHRLYSDNRTI